MKLFSLMIRTNQAVSRIEIWSQIRIAVLGMVLHDAIDSQHVLQIQVLLLARPVNDQQLLIRISKRDFT